MGNDRKINATKNFIWATIGNICNSLLTFISRTIFIYTLGTLFNGINGLYTNVLGMLSLAELGVGQAISFSLYKPLAENDTKKIQALMNFYRIAYRIIASVVLVIGLALVPFLKYIIKGADGVDHLVLYYLIFLFNTVSSYLLVYKSTLVEADQKKYIIININTVIKAAITVSQIIVLLVFRSFISYLIIGMIVQFLGNVYINYYCTKMYPYLAERNNERLNKSEKEGILTKIKALLAHMIGDKAVTQTDNIIISAFINVATVGLVSNYTMLINMISSFIIAFFNGSTAALGNIIVTEDKNKCFTVSKRFDFIGYIFYGWSSLCLFFLLTPFVKIWIGADKIVEESICLLLCLNYYLVGARVPLTNVKGAAGIFEQDKWLPLCQAVVNLVVSVVCAKILGVIGVFIGTLVSSMIPLIIRPIIVYKYVFDKPVITYYLEFLKRMVLTIFVAVVINLLFHYVQISNEILELLFRLIVCTLLFGVTVIVFYLRTDELKYLKETSRAFIANKVSKLK